VLREILAAKRKEMAGEYRRLHNEEIYGLYGSSNTFRVIKSRRITLEGHVARFGERRSVYRVLVGRLEGKNHLEDQA